MNQSPNQHLGIGSVSRTPRIKSKILLDRVFGLTTYQNASTCICESTGELIYPAGSVLVALGATQNSQRFFVPDFFYRTTNANTPEKSSNKSKTLHAVTHYGRYIVASEIGRNPSILFFDRDTQRFSLELKGSHTHGISCLSFTLSGKYLISVGVEHDHVLSIWDWRSAIIAESNQLHSPTSGNISTNNNVDPSTVGLVLSYKINAKIHAICSTEDNTFVTVGLRHIKIWTINDSSKPITIQPHSASCLEYRDHEFVDVVCGSIINSKTNTIQQVAWVVSIQGFLFMFDIKSRSMIKFVDLKIPANAISITSPKVLQEQNNDPLSTLRYLIIACNKGIVRLFNPETLDYIATLPRPNPLGSEIKSYIPSSKNNTSNLSNSSGQSQLIISTSSINNSSNESRSTNNSNNITLSTSSDSTIAELVYPDTACVKTGPHNPFHVYCIYNNRSIFVWDISNLKQISKVRSMLYHSSGITSLDILPQSDNSLKNSLNNLLTPTQSIPICQFPVDTFATGSTDGTIRFWSWKASSSLESLPVRNLYSRELINCISICSPQQMYENLALCGPTKGLGGTTTASSGTASALTTGIKTIKFNNDGTHIASGDRSGNIRVHQLVEIVVPHEQSTQNTQQQTKPSLQWVETLLPQIGFSEAHEGEVLSLSYTKTSQGNQLLASGSRDRLVHIFQWTGSNSTDINSSPSIERSLTSKRTISPMRPRTKVSGSKSSNEIDEYTLVSTIDDHSAAVTAVEFCQSNDSIYLLSASADKSIIFRKNSNTSSEQSIKRFHHAVVQCTVQTLKFTPNYMPTQISKGSSSSKGASPSGSLVVTNETSSVYLWSAGQEKRICIWDFSSAKLVKQWKLTSDEADVVKLDLDSTGFLVATASQDRYIRIYDAKTGELISSVSSGHSESITGLAFAAKDEALISTSADGCIFVWKLSSELQTIIKERKKIQTNSFRNKRSGLHSGSGTKRSASSSSISLITVPAGATSTTAGSQPMTKNALSSAPGSGSSPANSMSLGIFSPNASTSSLPPFDPLSVTMSSSTESTTFAQKLVSSSYLPPWAVSIHQTSEELKSKKEQATQKLLPKGSAWSANVPVFGISIHSNYTNTASDSDSKPPNILLFGKGDSLEAQLSKPPIVPSYLIGLPQTSNSSLVHPTTHSVISPTTHTSKLASSPEDEDVVIFELPKDTHPHSHLSGTPTISSKSTFLGMRSSDSFDAGDDEGDCDLDVTLPASEMEMIMSSQLENDFVFIPTASVVQGRKSLSARYFLNRTVDEASLSDIGTISTTNSSMPTQTSSAVHQNTEIIGTPKRSMLPVVSTPTRFVSKKEELALEVEKTKARLREMGISFGPKKTSVSNAANAGKATESVSPQTISSPVQTGSHVMSVSYQPLVDHDSIGETSDSRSTLASSTTDYSPNATLNSDIQDYQEIDAYDQLDQDGEDYYENDGYPEDSNLDNESYENVDGLLENEGEIATGSPPVTSRVYLASLSDAIDQTITLYKQLVHIDGTSKNRSSVDSSDSHIAKQLRRFISETKAKLDQLAVEDKSLVSDTTLQQSKFNSNDQTMEMLEKYSDMLVDVFITKINSKEQWNK